jgi:protein-cysteine N-palmitoyltransferase HHAT
MMMTANLVGFVIGLEGVQFFLQELFFTIKGVYNDFTLASFFTYPKSPGIQCFGFILVCLFIGTQVMFEYRYALPSL